jgi:parallel beta-helix repeat protein
MELPAASVRANAFLAFDANGKPTIIPSAGSGSPVGSTSASLVSYDQGGTGAAIRSVQAKLRESVSVKDFGAVGDGVADDTAAIQAAFSSLSANSNIVFPNGNYVISDSITCSTSALRIIGTGATITQTGSFKKSLNINACSNVRVEGLSFVGKGTEHSGGSSSYNGVAAVHMTAGCSDIEIVGCVMTNHAGGTIRWTGNGTRFRISGNRINGIGTSGGIVAGDNNGDFAIASFSSSADVDISISGNIVSGTCFGIGLTNHSGCVISNNIVSAIPGQHGIYLNRGSACVISSNNIRDIAYEGIKLQISDAAITEKSITISGNQVFDCGQSGIVLGAVTGISNSFIDDVVVDGNVVRDCGLYGIYARLLQSASITDNAISNAGAYGIYWNGSDGVISANTITNTEWNGMFLELLGTTYIQNNVIRNAVLNVAAAASGVDTLYYVWVAKDAAATSNPPCFIANNLMQQTGTVPTHFNTSGKCVRTSTDVLVYWMHNVNATKKAWQFSAAGELKFIDIGFSPDVAYTAAANENPSSPIYGHGRRELYCDKSPSAASSTDTFIRGDICWNSNVSTAGNVSGWICVTGGTPGTWQSFGATTRKSTTANRPTLASTDIGVMYLDTTLDADGKPIWWTGTAWVDATGATV